MNTSARRCLLLCFFVLLISGCLSIKHPYKKIDYYTLEYDSPQMTHLEPLPLVLRVERFQVAPVYDTNRIIYRKKPFARDPYSYHMWRGNPGNLVSYFLERDLRQSKAFKSVITHDGSLISSHVIEGVVDEFYEHDGNNSWEAVLSVSITLMAKNEPDISKKILLQKKYSARETCRQKNPQALAEAMSKAMAKLSASIIADVYNSLADAR